MSKQCNIVPVLVDHILVFPSLPTAGGVKRVIISTVPGEMNHSCMIL